LKDALADPSAAAYAHGILGSEYFKAGQVGAAIGELGEAARLVPGYHVFRSNLADAFLLNNQFQDAEREARQALRIDWASMPEHYILGLALLTQNIRIEEALDHLRAVAGTLSCARDTRAAYQSRQLSASVQRAQ
jgi:tetratricopeptide (TPR) repeat protein